MAFCFVTYNWSCFQEKKAAQEAGKKQIVQTEASVTKIAIAKDTSSSVDAVGVPAPALPPSKPKLPPRGKDSSSGSIPSLVVVKTAEEKDKEKNKEKEKEKNKEKEKEKEKEKAKETNKEKEKEKEKEKNKEKEKETNKEKEKEKEKEQPPRPPPRNQVCTVCRKLIRKGDPVVEGKIFL